MDVDNSGQEQNHKSCNQKSGKNGLKLSTNVKAAKKPSEKHPKTYSPVSDEGKNSVYFFYIR